MKFEPSSLKTGDIILFNNQEGGLGGWIASLIRLGSHSNYTHIGMILKDPKFLDKPLTPTKTLKGLYVWESGTEDKPDAEDGKKKTGVQITPLDEMITEYRKSGGKILIRRIEPALDENDVNYPFSDSKLHQIHELVHDKPYDLDPFDWMQELFIEPQRIKAGAKDKEGKEEDENEEKKEAAESGDQKTSRLWCSALVGAIYTKCGILDPLTEWSILSPSDFSLDGENLTFINGNKLENIEINFLEKS